MVRALFPGKEITMPNIQTAAYPEFRRVVLDTAAHIRKELTYDFPTHELAVYTCCELGIPYPSKAGYRVLNLLLAVTK